jgi:ATP-binding protein involved in chromosome partitioning
VTPDTVREALREVNCPGTKVNIVSIDLVGDIQVTTDAVHVEILHTTEKPETITKVQALVIKRLDGRVGSRAVEVTVTRQEDSGHGDAHGHAQANAHAANDPFQDQAPLPGVRQVLAIASAKGGVGKSSVAVNLALALAAQDHQVGLMDADIYGPSLPTMLGVKEVPEVTEDNKIIPLQVDSLQMMSMGFMLPPDQPVVWRGPMVFAAVKQFLKDVQWHDLDILVVDLPPGTGDAQLTLVQQVPLSGVIMVTTPQEIALADVRRGIQMFRGVQVPVLGVVENMSFFLCPDNNKKYYLFGQGGGQLVAEQFRVPLLAQIPIEPSIREGGDAGRPAVNDPASPARETFLALAREVDGLLKS